MEPQEPQIDSRMTARAEAERVSIVEDITYMARRVDEAGQVGWLAEPLWPSDAYGVIAAKDKAGKTWVVTDLAVSVATGTPWLGRFTCPQGNVLMYCGEGGARNIVRRVRAVAAHKGIPFGLLEGHLHVAEEVPRLKDRRSLEVLSSDLDLYGPRVVVVDPLYLAAAGGKGSDLYAMGEVLSPIQAICQGHGAALVVTHHHKKGDASGMDRMTGVGPTAWGRVLGSGNLASSHVDGGRSVVQVEWEFLGSEIAGSEFTMTRTVWAEDPTDLTSPLHYEVEVAEGFSRLLLVGERVAEQRERVLAYVIDNPGQSTRAIERALGRSARDDLFGLRADGKVDYVLGRGRSNLWSAS